MVLCFGESAVPSRVSAKQTRRNSVERTLERGIALFALQQGTNS